MSDKPLAITIMGPTAAGKTDLAIALRERCSGELISVDSALVYRGLDIGSAKPSRSEQEKAPHRLINICDPSQPYSAADFCRDARKEIHDIRSQGKTPILVGGTMLYFKALLEGLSPMPKSDAKAREEIELQAVQKGWPSVHERLAKIDPIAAERIHPNHSQRLSRALEVYLVSGKTMTEWQSEAGKGLLEEFNWVQLAVSPRDRAVLHRRIQQRFDAMLELGFEKEVKQLQARGDLHKDLPAIRAVGYRQMWDYLVGESSFDEMREKGIAATRQLAKRQLTWLRGWEGVNWVYTQNEEEELLSSCEIVNTALNFLPTTTI